MDSVLQSLLFEWDQLKQMQFELLQQMPEYPVLKRDFMMLTDKIRPAIDPKLFLEYDAALGAYLALGERASLLTGAHVTLRLLTSLL